MILATIVDEIAARAEGARGLAAKETLSLSLSAFTLTFAFASTALNHLGWRHD